MSGENHIMVLTMFTGSGRGMELSGVFHIGKPIPFMRGPPSWLNLPKALSSSAITLGVGISTQNGGHTHSAHSIRGSCFLCLKHRVQKSRNQERNCNLKVIKHRDGV